MALDRKSIVRTYSTAAAQSGASMVEAALVIVLFLGLLGATIDLGIGLTKLNTITHLNNTVVRQSAGGVSPIECAGMTFLDSVTWTVFYRYCKGLEEKVPPLLGDDSLKCADFGIKPNPELNAFDLFSGTAQVQVKCFFCIFFPGILNVRATSQTNLENTWGAPEVRTTRCPAFGIDSVVDSAQCPSAIVWPPIINDACP